MATIEYNENNSDIQQDYTLKYGNKPHILTNEDRVKGGMVKSDNKKIAARLRYYSNPSLSCITCHSKCFLYNSGANDCYKGLLLKNIRDIGRASNPEEIFDLLFENLAEMVIDLQKDITELDADGKIVFQKRKILADLLLQTIKTKFNDSQINDNKPEAPDPVKFAELMRIARERDRNNNKSEENNCY